MRLTFLAATFFATLSSLHAEPRDWTNHEGKTIQAEFVRVEGKNVVLKLQNGNSANFPIEKLSSNDQKWLQSAIAQSPPAPPSAQPPASRPNISGFNQADTSNTPKVWPGVTRPPATIDVEILEEDSAKNIYRYATANFEFTCSCKLGKSAVRDLAETFEGTLAAVQALPLPLRRQPSLHGKFQAQIFESEDQYLAAGAPQGSAGVYMSKTDSIYLPVTSIGLTKMGSQWKAARGKNLHTLVHELTHQLVNSNVQRDPWFLEGLAEYFACSHKNDGVFDFKNNKKSIYDYATAYGSRKENRGRALGKDISIPPLSQFMTWEYSQFVAGMGDKEDKSANRNYGVALLMLYWFLHGDNNAYSQRVSKYMDFLANQPVPNPQSLQDARKLLFPDGGSWPELEKELASGFKKLGLSLKFAE